MAESAPEHEYVRAEHDHIENTASGVIRASIFGVSDGLVSNLALVMGVAGGTQSSSAIVLAGSAGLLAGAFSMGAGEYISMQTQKEAMERQLHVEREHILLYPDEEEAALVKILEDSGLDAPVAREMAGRIHENVDPAVDFHALLELGIVPGQMGSPIAASLSSFASFIVGAAIPLIPWLFDDNALVHSIIASAVALLLVGGAITVVTGRSVIVGAFRQLFFGAVAAGITYGLGHLIGASF